MYRHHPAIPTLPQAQAIVTNMLRQDQPARSSPKKRQKAAAGHVAYALAALFS